MQMKPKTNGRSLEQQASGWLRNSTISGNVILARGEPGTGNVNEVNERVSLHVVTAGSNRALPAEYPPNDRLGHWIEKRGNYSIRQR